VKETPIDILRHMIGIDKDVNLTGKPWRNHYAASVGSDAERDLLSMAAEGLVQPGRTINNGELRYFHATDAGIERARDDERQHRKAAGLRRWRVSYPMGDTGTGSSIVLAKSRAAARWDVALDMMDVGADKMWWFRNIRAHIMRPTVGGIDVF